MGRKSFALKLHKVFFPPTPAVKFYSSKRYLTLSACYACQIFFRQQGITVPHFFRWDFTRNQGGNHRCLIL